MNVKKITTGTVGMCTLGLSFERTELVSEGNCTLGYTCKELECFSPQLLILHTYVDRQSTTE